jgi:DNA-binding transcriptional LysR family regulator
MSDYTLRQLEYFVAVAEAASVTRAAASVHLSQSAMSAALADLENALSVQLLVRHHARGISLTPAGKELLTASRQLLASAADLRAVAQGLGTSLSGTLSIGCFEVVAPYLLPELLSAAAQKLPKLHLQTTEVDLADLAEGVANGTFELGIGYDLVDDPRLKRWPLFTLPPYVLLSGSHRLATRDHVDLTELADEPMAHWICRTAGTTSERCSPRPVSRPTCAIARRRSRRAARWSAAGWPTPSSISAPPSTWPWTVIPWWPFRSAGSRPVSPSFC